MLPNTDSRSPYPPVEVAIALAARSHTLPGSTPAGRARLAFVVKLGLTENWSEATRAAHALREVDWLATARHFKEPLDRLWRLDPAVLLAWLNPGQDRTI
jgi:hypothetical protein